MIDQICARENVVRESILFSDCGKLETQTKENGSLQYFGPVENAVSASSVCAVQISLTHFVIHSNRFCAFDVKSEQTLTKPGLINGIYT